MFLFFINIADKKQHLQMLGRRILNDMRSRFHPYHLAFFRQPAILQRDFPLFLIKRGFQSVPAERRKKRRTVVGMDLLPGDAALELIVRLSLIHI